MKHATDVYIEKSRDAMIRDIRALVSVESINGRGAACREALDRLLCRAEQFGMETGMTSAGDAGYIELGSGAVCVGMLVHVDVVDVGDAAKWRFAPFSGEVADGFIWGRGTVDDKGAAVMCLYAMRALLESGVEFKGRVRLIIGTNEEGDWTDMQHYIDEFGMPDFGFAPDGDFPICNAEKGYADVQLSFCEPQHARIAALSSAGSPNSIPSKALIEWADGVTEEFHGVSAHSSEPHYGKNAIIRLAASEKTNGFNFARFINDFARDDDLCPALGIDDGNEFIGRERVGRTTAVPTVLSLEGNCVKLNLNVRQKFGVSRADILSTISGYASDYGFEAKLMPGFLPATMVSSMQEPLRIMKQVYEEYGYKAEFFSAAGTSYAKAMPNFVSWGPVFRTDPSCFHAENERLSLNTMTVATKMYARFLFRTACADGEASASGRTTSIEKALSLIELFMQKPYSFTLAELCTMSGMNRTTVYRDLTAFENVGILIRDPQTKAYSMGPEAFRMGNVYLRGAKYQESILVLLERIAEETKESVGLARREGNSVISIYSVENHQPVKMNDLPGEFYPMNKGTYGKCLMAFHDSDTVRTLLSKAHFERTCTNTLTRTEDILAEYESIRNLGYVLSIEETAPLIIGVGVPLTDSSGCVRNVLSVSFLKHADYLERIESIKAVLFRYKPLVEACL